MFTRYCYKWIYRVIHPIYACKICGELEKVSILHFYSNYNLILYYFSNLQYFEQNSGNIFNTFFNGTFCILISNMYLQIKWLYHVLYLPQPKPFDGLTKMSVKHSILILESSFFAYTLNEYHSINSHY